MLDVGVRLVAMIKMPDMNLYPLSFLQYLVNFICMHELTVQRQLVNSNRRIVQCVATVFHTNQETTQAIFNGKRRHRRLFDYG